MKYKAYVNTGDGGAVAASLRIISSRDRLRKQKRRLTSDNAYVIIRVKGNLMFELGFYEDRRGTVGIADYPDELQERAKTSKDARINRQKILAYMASLQECGTRSGAPAENIKKRNRKGETKSG